ncbi:MAG TPA: hypothetical protein VLQ45_23170 [Thermoanaerobaculia bacterium]|nr:hypothetical protein [Thermoanaerobaculia bacterium]
MATHPVETDPIDDVLEMADRMIELSRTERARVSKELDSLKELAPLDTPQLLAPTHS